MPFGIWEPVCLLPLIITDDAGLHCCRDIFKHELWATSALPAPEEPETSIQRPKVCYWHHNIVFLVLRNHTSTAQVALKQRRWGLFSLLERGASAASSPSGA